MSGAQGEIPQPAGWVRAALIGLLPLLVMGIWWHGQRHVPERDSSFMQKGPETQVQQSSIPSQLLHMSRLGEVRHYNEANLYEYINGHAEAYISAGFERLQVVEFAAKGVEQPQMVVDLYHMGSAIQAFGILQDEVGEQTRSVTVGEMGYASDNQLLFIRGPYFIKVNRFERSVDLLQASTLLANALEGQGTALHFPFPDFGQAHSLHYIRSDYHGLDFLKGVVERSFGEKKQRFKAFLMRQPQDLLDQTILHMQQFYGAEEIPFHARHYQKMPYTVVEDPYEGSWFFVAFHDHFWGVWTEPSDLHLAALHRMWSKLQQGEPP
ncbi:DUF6599 family protein [Magnetococcus sp. PR-3]|uniref:DUF6599 family protein n=1 Tax=Magnetococcus sp. PR-3 TaxID=3120355 RepID=UPI002FCE1924